MGECGWMVVVGAACCSDLLCDESETAEVFGCDSVETRVSIDLDEGVIALDIVVLSLDLDGRVLDVVLGGAHLVGGREHVRRVVAAVEVHGQRGLANRQGPDVQIVHGYTERGTHQQIKQGKRKIMRNSERAAERATAVGCRYFAANTSVCSFADR